MSAYDELGGQSEDRWVVPKSIPCPNCGAEVDSRCVNPITKLPSRISCVARRPRRPDPEAA